MHALVTGSSGFIGRHLCDSLLKLGHKVSPFCRSQGGDILQWGDVRQWVVPDVVYHLAGMLSTASPRDIYEVNVLGTLNLLEFCRLHKVRQLVYASSYLYGLPNYLPVDEGHPLNGEGAYAKSKILAEELCKAYAHEFGLSIVSLRVFNAYGPNQHGQFLIPTILSQIVEGKEVVLHDPEPKRDFVYIDDLVGAFLLAANYGELGFSSFNVATGVSISVHDLVQKIFEYWGGAIPIRYIGKRRTSEIMDCRGCTDHIFETLGWTSKVSIEEGLQRTVKWWKTCSGAKI